MDGRKQLGILTMVATFMHMIMSAFLWMPSYYAKLFEADVQVNDCSGASVHCASQESCTRT
jgi:hypothetical protein